MSRFEWRVVDGGGLGSVLDSLARSRSARRDFGEVEQVRWLVCVAKRLDAELLMLTLQAGGDLVGCVPVFCHPTKLDLGIGDISLASVPIDRAAIEIGPLMDWARIDEDPSAMFEELFRKLLDVLGEGVVFLGGVEIDGELGSALSGSRTLSRLYHVVRHGPRYEHRFATLDAGFEDYLRSLGKRTRKDLRRTRKAFTEKLKERYSVRVYESPEETEALLEDAGRISRKTYQWHLLGQVVKPESAVAGRIEAAAGLGYLKSYVLLVDGDPIAFQIGYRFGALYAAHETGFDPEWRKLQPGIFLMTEIFSDIAADSWLQIFDFGVGDSLSKRRLSNFSRTEQLYYLFPRTWRGTTICTAKRGVDTLSRGLGIAARRLGARDLIRKTLRERARRGTG